MNRAVKGMSAIIGLLVSRLPRRRVRGWGAGRDADAARDALPPDRYRELGDEGAQKDIRVVSGAHGHGQFLSSWFLRDEPKFIQGPLHIRTETIWPKFQNLKC